MQHWHDANYKLQNHNIDVINEQKGNKSKCVHCISKREIVFRR